MQTFNEFKINEAVADKWAVVNISKDGYFIVISRPMTVADAAKFLLKNQAIGGVSKEPMAIIDVNTLVSMKGKVIGGEYLK